MCRSPNGTCAIRRNEPVARWIRRQAGHTVRLVHIGRPWADPGLFDLIVTTPQYELPDGPNVLRVDLPLHRITRARLEQDAASWRPRLAHLPPPRIALLVGGESGRFHLDAAKAGRLGRAASALAAQMAGREHEALEKLILVRVEHFQVEGKATVTALSVGQHDIICARR